METLTINIKNPKAKKIIQNLADLELISINKKSKNDFLDFVRKIRKKSEKNPISLDEITAEVEKVRSEKHGK